MRIRPACGWFLSLVSLAALCFSPAELRGAADTLPVDEAREQALLRAAGEGFSIKRTRHFAIAYDTPRELADQLTARLERTYAAVYRFCELAGIDAHRPEHRLEAIFFNDRSRFDLYAVRLSFPSQGTYGVYHDPTNRSAFFNVGNDPQMLRLHANVAQAQQGLDRMLRAIKDIRGRRTMVDVQFADGRQLRMTKAQAEKEIKSTRHELKELDGERIAYTTYINRTVVQHETAHQVLHNAGVHVRGADNPKWVVEGLATLFETPPGAGGAGIGKVNDLRLRDFRRAIAGGAPLRSSSPNDFLEAIKAGRIVHPRRLVSEPELFGARGLRATRHYATAWALTHYLHRTRGKQLGAYLRSASTRRPGEQFTPAQELALFERHFGPIDETFLRRWSGYMLKLGFRSVGGGP